MTERDPYRPTEAPRPQTTTVIDPIEQAAVDAIASLREEFSWTVRRAASCDVERIEEGFGVAVAKIVDSVRRLRDQKLGGGR